MNAFRFFLIPVVGIALSTASAWAQGKSTKDQITGTWSLVSYEAIAADGSRKPLFSPKPKGTLMLQANGRYAMIIVDPDRPKKWGGKSRANVSAEDLATAARGVVAQFGEWSVDEDGKTLIRKNEGGLNPLAAGREQLVQISVSGDELKTRDATSAFAGSAAETVWRRVK